MKLEREDVGGLCVPANRAVGGNKGFVEGIGDVVKKLVVFLSGFAYYFAKMHWFPDPAHPIHLEPNWRMALLPVFLLQITMVGVGLGMIIAALTTMKTDATAGNEKKYSADQLVFQRASVDREKVAVKLGFKTCGRSHPAK